ncbi:MAG: histone deacetylase family protein [Deltaproteobacteria bacterium]|nr:histone deacetylase family protein [Deltaproteobacteria bacterium]MBW1961036.1 histone deacetylase family protein [Deltaproteobacteria bacterium]MBW2153361.1 histone deacetylase family protein [Deltaproteobacteria bacterium]
MKVVFHNDFYQVYTSDPAAAAGRMEAIVEAIKDDVIFVEAQPALEAHIAAVHSGLHIESVRQMGLYEISALAAGGAVRAAEIGLLEPSFGLVRPPGHHASTNSSWGFCYFNNIAIAIEALKRAKKIETAFVLDIDLHYGDGTVNILGKHDYVTICNVEARDQKSYMDVVTTELASCTADIIGVSAGFDNHQQDWGGLLSTENYREIGEKVRQAARRCEGGCFGVLEGGYNHRVLGENVMAFLKGLSGG